MIPIERLNSIPGRPAWCSEWSSPRLAESAVMTDCDIGGYCVLRCIAARLHVSSPSRPMSATGLLEFANYARAVELFISDSDAASKVSDALPNLSHLLEDMQDELNRGLTNDNEAGEIIAKPGASEALDVWADTYLTRPEYGETPGYWRRP